MVSAIESAPKGSIILLHACAHNPTGVDPTQEQWKKIAEVVRAGSHFPFFDCAYQGFASGDLSRDAWAVRYFVEQGFEMCVAQSYAKNFGLYGERAGAFHFIAPPGAAAQDTATRVASQLAILQRSEISNPPIYGAKIASIVLNDDKLFADWEEDLRTMSGRIIDMRKVLKGKLDGLGTPGTWNHITSQIGMFSFTGLNEKQVGILRDKWHIYMVSLQQRHPPLQTFWLQFKLLTRHFRPRTGASPWRVSTPTTWTTSPRRSTVSCARPSEPALLRTQIRRKGEAKKFDGVGMAF